MQGIDKHIDKHRGFAEIKGQKKAVEILRMAYASERLVHAYLFHGPAGVGKMTAALVFASLLNCEAPQDAEPCGSCADCRKIGSGNHPDVLVVKPDGASVKIAQMRSLQEKASYRCYEGKTKVIIIDEAHLMTSEAANSLLKILEEPPEATVFILLAKDAKNLPSTILSRCRPVPFAYLEDETIAGILAEKGLDNKLPLGLAQGSVGRAMELSEKPVFARLYQEIAGLYAKLPELSRYDLLKWVEELHKEKDKDRELLDFALDILTFLYRDSMMRDLLDSQGGGQTGQACASRQASAESCVAALQEINRTGAYLKSNVNSRLAVEVLLLNLRNMALERGA